jgi:transcriptional regulator with XRE-family HTH domain
MTPSLAVDPYFHSQFEGTAPLAAHRVAPRPDPFDWWVKLVRVEPRPSPDAQRRIQEIRTLTGWSDRQIARALGTSHPTVAAMMLGRLGRLGHRARISTTYDVVARIYALCERDVEATDRVLAFSGSDGAPSPLDLLSRDEPSAAYLAAIDRIRPRRQGLMTGSRPAVPGLATEDLARE